MHIKTAIILYQLHFWHNDLMSGAKHYRNIGLVCCYYFVTEDRHELSGHNLVEEGNVSSYETDRHRPH